MKYRSFFDYLYIGVLSLTLVLLSEITLGQNYDPNYSENKKPNNSFASHLYFGGGLGLQYFIFENVFAHVEYETLAYNTREPNQTAYMQQYDSFFVGGGYNQRIGGNSAMYILVLWNLNDTQYSPYSNPVIRVGFSFGL